MYGSIKLGSNLTFPGNQSFFFSGHKQSHFGGTEYWDTYQTQGQSCFLMTIVELDFWGWFWITPFNFRATHTHTRGKFSENLTFFHLRSTRRCSRHFAHWRDCHRLSGQECSYLIINPRVSHWQGLEPFECPSSSETSRGVTFFPKR